MKPEALGKIVIDAFMAVSLMILMRRQFWGDAAHEWMRGRLGYDRRRVRI
jgi:hypothetical protein